MMASVFFVLSPGLARLFGIVVFYRKFGSFRHPSFGLLMAAHAPYLFVVPIGDNDAPSGVA